MVLTKETKMTKEKEVSEIDTKIVDKHEKALASQILEDLESPDPILTETIDAE
jgi:hypothetical protein